MVTSMAAVMMGLVMVDPVHPVAMAVSRLVAHSHTGRGWCVRPWTSPWPSRLVVGRHGRQNKAGHPRANLIDRTKIAKSIKNRSLFLKVKVHLTLHEHFVDNHKFD